MRASLSTVFLNHAKGGKKVGSLLKKTSFFDFFAHRKELFTSFSPLNTNGGEQRAQNKSELRERCIHINTRFFYKNSIFLYDLAKYKGKIFLFFRGKFRENFTCTRETTTLTMSYLAETFINEMHIMGYLMLKICLIMRRGMFCIINFFFFF